MVLMPPKNSHGLRLGIVFPIFPIMQRAKRIWRAAALEELLANLSSDPLDGLIKLSEFWSGWERPADAPLLMILGAMTLPQNQYHSASNYDHVAHVHEQWLKNELVALICRNAAI